MSGKDLAAPRICIWRFLEYIRSRRRERHELFCDRAHLSEASTPRAPIFRAVSRRSMNHGAPREVKYLGLSPYLRIGQDFLIKEASQWKRTDERREGRSWPQLAPAARSTGWRSRSGSQGRKRTAAGVDCRAAGAWLGVSAGDGSSLVAGRPGLGRRPERISRAAGIPRVLIAPDFGEPW